MHNSQQYHINQLENNFDLISRFEKDCLAQMTANGISFAGPLKTDGEIHRFSTDEKKNQPDEWYVCHQGVSKHNIPYLSCTYGSWSGDQKFYYKSYENNSSFTKEELFHLKEAEERKRKEIDQQLAKDLIKRIEEAKKNWEESSDVATSINHTKYLENKKVKAYGVKYGFDSYRNPVLVIPLKNIKGEIQAIQNIGENGEKRFYGPKKGNFHLIGEIRNDSHIYVTEGYATAASVYEGTESPVVVAFDCGNLNHVVSTLRGKYPKHQITIAADDDKETDGNPGKKKAEEASKNFGCNVVFPQFPDDFRLINSISEKFPNGRKPTDFNDLHNCLGIDELKKQLCKKKSYLTPVDIGTFLSKELPPRKIILNPWLTEQGLAMIYAKRGIGKTFISLSIAYAIACGGKVLKWEAIHPRKVLYIDGEMPAVSMQERLAHIARGSEKQPPDASFFKLITPDLQDLGIRDLNTIEGQQDVNEHLEDVDVLFLDNLSTLVRSGRENESDSWIYTQEWLLSLRKKGKSVVFIHHAGKGGAQRGSSKKEDVLDTVIVLKQPKNYSPTEGARFEVHFEKSRGFEGEQANPFEASLITHESGVLEWSFKEIEMRDLDRITELYNDGMTNQRDISRELDIALGKVNKLIKQARNEQKIK
jgi:putative DNA primase/helicase